MKLPEKGVLVIEGIFCLNDALTPKVPSSDKFKIFIGPLSPLKLDNLNYVSNQSLRTIRRISRDFLHRARSARDTIKKWPAVKEGEVEHIFPYVRDADAVFNSSLDYELNVLKVRVLPLLETVVPSEKEYPVAQELIALLNLVAQTSDTIVPSTSIV